MEATKQLIMNYWRSWQIADWDLLRSSLHDQIHFGGQAITADAFTEMCASGTPWRDVEMLDSVFTRDSGALLYEGTDTRTGHRIRVGEFVHVENGRIARMQACFGTGHPDQTNTDAH
ncbi:MAG: hypothetical protein R3330_05480 [Saprospiraceae bacterium]|nr:hypothetical protein [Saprospiraceae bacterium]